MSALDIILFLKDVPLFESLTNFQLAEVARLGEKVEYPAGCVLFNQGDPPDYLYLMRTGRVRIIAGGQDLSQLGPGECIGEMGVLANMERSATVETLEQSQMLRFDGDDFLALLDTYPEIQRALIKALVNRLAQAGQRAESKRHQTLSGMPSGGD